MPHGELRSRTKCSKNCQGTDGQRWALVGKGRPQWARVRVMQEASGQVWAAPPLWCHPIWLQDKIGALGNGFGLVILPGSLQSWKKLLSSPGCFVKCQIGWCQKRWEMNYSVLLTSPTVSDWDWDTGSVRLESAAVASNWTDQCLARELKLQQRCVAKNEKTL